MDFSSQEEAQQFLDSDPADPENVNSDHGGNACEPNGGNWLESAVGDSSVGLDIPSWITWAGGIAGLLMYWVAHDRPSRTRNGGSTQAHIEQARLRLEPRRQELEDRRHELERFWKKLQRSSDLGDAGPILMDCQALDELDRLDQTPVPTTTAWDRFVGNNMAVRIAGVAVATFILLGLASGDWSGSGSGYSDEPSYCAPGPVGCW